MVGRIISYSFINLINYIIILSIIWYNKIYLTPIITLILYVSVLFYMVYNAYKSLSYIFKSRSYVFNIKNITNLIDAAGDNNVEIIKKILLNRNLDINLLHNNTSALLNACSFNCFESVELLLKYPNIDVNIQNNEGCTSLMMTQSFNDTKIAELLIANPDIDVNIQDKDGFTALMIACRYDNVQLLKLLLSHPDINVYLSIDFYALMFWIPRESPAKKPYTAYMMANDAYNKDCIILFNKFYNGRIKLAQRVYESRKLHTYYDRNIWPMINSYL